MRSNFWRNMTFLALIALIASIYFWFFRPSEGTETYTINGLTISRATQLCAEYAAPYRYRYEPPNNCFHETAQGWTTTRIDFIGNK